MVWISKQKWENLEKRIADLEVVIQSQPKEIVEILMEESAKVQKERQKQAMKSNIRHRNHWN